MNFLQSVIEALESLNANKMRSGLTILGIVIGVAAVIAMLGIGRGAQETITGAISGIGTNLLFIFRGSPDDSVRNPEPLTLQDAAALQDPFAAPAVAGVTALLAGNGTVSAAGEQKVTTVNGVTPSYFVMRNYTLLEGDFFGEDAILGRKSVVLLGVDVADALFGRRQGLVGEIVRIEGQPFRIIGVLAPKGGSSFGSEDDRVVIPLSTAQARILRRSNNKVDIIIVQAASSEQVNAAIEQVSQILRTRHHTPIGQDDFTIMSQQDFLDTASTITGVLTIFLGGIAAISLLVGGIGIMNIMLVSVTERTREIGLRKALGARKRDILIQFLTESSLLSLVGGLIGIALGWGISYAVSLVATRSGTPFDAKISLDAILLATLFSAAVGLFFGIYPANRAASLEPVEALRYE